MQVVGKTNEREIWVGSSDRPFRLNELMVVPGLMNEWAVGEVIETYSLNPMIPLVDEGSPFIMDTEVMNNLNLVGYDLEKDTIYIAKLRVLNQLFYPVKTGSVLRSPLFSEVSGFLVKTSPIRSLAIGVILGTESLEPSLPDELQSLAPLFELGRVVPQVGVPFLLDYRNMQDYPHIGVFGGSGSGKSFGLRVLIEELMHQQVPVLVFDPHFEMSFAEPLTSDMDNNFQETFESSTVILTVGRDIGVRFEDINENDLCNLLGAISPLSEAMEAAVRALLLKNDSLNSYRTRLDDLTRLMDTPENEFREEFVKRGLKTDQEREWNRLKAMQPQIGQVASLKAIRWRLAALEREGIFHPSGLGPVDTGIRCRKTVVIRGSIRILRVYASYVLRSLYGKRRSYRDATQKGESAEKFPPFFVITDEAHNFAPKGEIPSPARREFREISQEGRKYGVFLVLATQRPALLDDTINAQLNTKIIFRTVRSADLKTISEETDLGAEEIRRLPYMPSGLCFISTPLVGRTVAVRIRAAKTRSPHQINPFDELEEMVHTSRSELMEVVNRYLPINETDINEILKDTEKKGIRISRLELESTLAELVTAGELIKEDNGFITVYKINNPEVVS